MGKEYSALDGSLREYIQQQHLFFVGTAPSGSEGHLNVSPKGLDTFRILDPATVAYLDLTGSGVETIAHLRENGRVTILFCALEGSPKILRLYGRGEVIDAEHAEFGTLRPLFPSLDGVRSVIRVRLERIADSCGYGVPRYRYEGERDQLLAWASRKGPEGLRDYRAERNRTSIDGLPGLAPTR
jgi:hypothetical protein